MTGIPAIALRDVGKVFVRDDGTAVSVLEHISFEIAAGSFVCLVGRSGSGKSTILNMIAGLIEPSSGTIAFADGSSKRPRLDVGYMTQKETLLPWRDVIKNVAMPLEVRGVARAERETRARNWSWLCVIPHDSRNCWIRRPIFSTVSRFGHFSKS